MANNELMNINVMMFGGRRCGKTSILAAMMNSFKDIFGKTNLSITTADFSTESKLEEKNEEIRSYYKALKDGFKNSGNTYITPDDSPTMDIDTYSFEIFLKNKKNSRVKLNFYDYNGEYLDDEEGFNKILSIAQLSDVIMAAVDTPYLMEELTDDSKEATGLYCNRKNKCSRIANVIDKAFMASSETNEKMILLVPIKCEKYYHESNVFAPEINSLADVNVRLKSAYNDLINEIDNEFNRGFYEMAVTPILTMGNLVFAGFQRDEATREYIMNKAYNYPAAPQYTLRQWTENIKPEPQFCEQPLVYSLLYAIKMAEKGLGSINKGGFFSRIGKKFQSAMGRAFAEDFMPEEKMLLEKLKTQYNECGFEIITDPLGFLRGENF